jgi:outer membrane receptor protein involved in Fe transport
MTMRLWLFPLLLHPVVASAAYATDAESQDIIVWGRAIAQIGLATSGSEGTVGYRDFENRPLSRVGELAENVPGLIATQHSGTGKANQFFLRGFNLDHGTDLAGFVDGAPVNMRSHGHGQGYLDLNFLIPEAVERIDFAKGPYHADTGDFAAAGTLRFATRTRLEQPFAEVQAGQFGYLRGLAGGSTEMGGGDVLGIVEGTLSNGPWDLDEDLQKFNSLLKWSTPRVRIGLSAYTARWNATDQVPERAIADETIGRFGNIDPDLGGSSTRLALNVEGTGERTRWSAYAIRSNFSLTSNFTYFLDNPAQGDQFIQRDRRWVLGGSLDHRLPLNDRTTLRLGGDLRGDLIGKLGLYRSSGGVSREAVREDSVDQWGGAPSSKRRSARPTHFALYSAFAPMRSAMMSVRTSPPIQAPARQPYSPPRPRLPGRSHPPWSCTPTMAKAFTRTTCAVRPSRPTRRRVTRPTACRCSHARAAPSWARDMRLTASA